MNINAVGEAWSCFDVIRTCAQWQTLDKASPTKAKTGSLVDVFQGRNFRRRMFQRCQWQVIFVKTVPIVC